MGAVALAGCLGDDDDDAVADDDDDDDVDDDITVPDIPSEFVEEDPAGPEAETIVFENLDADFPVRFRYGETHVGVLRDIGFDVEFNVRALGAHLDQTFVARNQDLMALRWLDGFDPDRPLRDSNGRAALSEGGGNVGNHWNPEFDELLTEQATAPDADTRQELVFEGQRYLVEEEVSVTPSLVQSRAMPYNNERVEGAHEFLEDGLAGITNMVEISTPDGELFTTQTEDLTTLNPLDPARGRADRDHVRLMFDRLAHPIPETDYLPSPWAAESIEQPDDLTVEVTLREGLEFHDGESVDAEDIEFSYTYGAEHNAGLAGVTENVEEIVVVDDLTVRFELSASDAVFLTRGLSGRDASILPKHILEDVDDPSDWDTDDVPLIGSGAYSFNEWRIGEELILDAHDAHQFAPNVDRLVRVQAADAAAGVALIEDQAIDMGPYDFPPDQIARLAELDFISINESLMTSIHYHQYNMHPNKDGPFRFLEARDAVAHTVDREGWLDVAAGGFGEVLTTLMSPGLGFWAAPPDVVSPQEFDVDQAIQKLGEAGFRWDPDGVIHYPENPDDALTTQRERWEASIDDLPDMPIPFEP